LLDSNVDDQLSALGQAPSDMRALVTRVLGDQPLTLANADALLASLTEGRAFPLPSGPREQLETIGMLGGAMGAMPAPVTNAPVLAPASLMESPLTASAPLFDSQPPPPSAAPPVFETRSAPFDPASDPSSVFDDRPDAETTAQAIVAAFDDSDAEASSDVESPEPLDTLALELGANSSLEIQPERPLRRETRGSRRPDLDELLDQPLDALDFERTEPVPQDTDADAHTSDIPTDLPPPGASGDDFEILVDDEILEIAEDDVELVDDDSSN
jgi:hypothetical protein